MAVYKDEEKGTWYAKFRYTDWTGKARSTTRRGFRTKREAKQFEVDFKRTSMQLQQDMTMEELCKQYLEAMKPRWKAKTYELQSCTIRLYILPTLANLKISDINTATVMKWQNHMLATGHSDATLNSRNGTLSSILNYAVKMEWIQKNPARNVRRIGAQVRRLDFWTVDEYNRFLQAGEGSRYYEKYRLCFDILFYSGIRVGEFLGLGKNSFDFSNNQIIIRHAINPLTGEKDTPKTRQSYRRITMPRSIMDRIRHYIDHLYECPETQMFIETKKALADRLIKWSQDAGIKHINIHGLRHSHASYLISLGVPITVISKRLGHKTPKITLDTYSHMYDSDESSVADIMEEKMDVGQCVVTQKK